MPVYYTYLISSLPMLHFQAKPPFSFQEFMERCADMAGIQNIGILKAATRKEEDSQGKDCPAALKKWWAFDRGLRNELVRIRAGRRHIDAHKYIRADGYTESHIAGLALAAYRNPLPLESERLLDLARWNFLDELSAGHFFDIDVLVVYAIKLLILEKWERINSADRPALIEELCQYEPAA